jgi:dTMP kinase
MSKYIVADGPDGAGKSTQVKKIRLWLEAAGYDVVSVSEPGGTPIGEAIRAILKDKHLLRDPKTNLDMFMAVRRELYLQVIAPALASGKVVLADRSYISSIAYQGFAEGLGGEDVLHIARESLDPEMLAPDLGLIFTLPAAQLMGRIKSRGSQDDYFEVRGIEYFSDVVNGFRWATNELDLVGIDASQNIDNVWAQILPHLTKLTEVYRHGI